MPVLIGFAAETGDPSARAARKRSAKRADLIIANDVSAPGSGFDVETNQVTFITGTSVDALPLLPKSAVAAAILDRVEALLQAPSRGAAPDSRLDEAPGRPAETAAR
jgi:phosphopantothenoylcysteine decarboxylase/phosphopantothenate--cysteine ligase